MAQSILDLFRPLPPLVAVEPKPLMAGPPITLTGYGPYTLPATPNGRGFWLLLDAFPITDPAAYTLIGRQLTLSSTYFPDLSLYQTVTPFYTAGSSLTGSAWSAGPAQTVSGYGPYALPRAPNGKAFFLYLDGSPITDPVAFNVTGSQLLLNPSVFPDLSLYQDLTPIFTTGIVSSSEQWAIGPSLNVSGYAYTLPRVPKGTFWFYLDIYPISDPKFYTLTGGQLALNPTLLPDLSLYQKLIPMYSY